MIIADAADMAAALRAARLAKGMTQAELAALVGVSRQWVMSAESGSETVRLGLMLTALRCVDLVVQTEADTSGAVFDAIFDGARHA